MGVFKMAVCTRLFHSGDGLTGTPLTTSARISALNIVGELLRKVGVRRLTRLFRDLKAGFGVQVLTQFV